MKISPRHWNTSIMDMGRYVSRMPRWVIATSGLLFIIFVGVLDYKTGTQISFSVFYLLPIALVSWLTSTRIGLVMATLSVLAWLIADLAFGIDYAHPLIPYWNTLVRYLVFLAVVFLESALKNVNHSLERRVDERTALLAAEIDERKRVEAQLEQYAKRLLEVQEAERRMIARELHDEIGQALTGIAYTLEVAAQTQTDTARTKLDRAYTLVGELTEKISQMSLELRPALLDDLGLLPTLLWYLDRYSSQTKITPVLKHSGLEEQRLDARLETAAFRIVQEALTNVARHTHVNRVKVTVWLDQGILGVQVEDDGTGFDVDAAFTSGNSSGLSGMRERAMLLKGKLTIESAPDVGTRVLAELPIGT